MLRLDRLLVYFHKIHLNHLRKQHTFCKQIDIKNATKKLLKNICAYKSVQKKISLTF